MNNINPFLALKRYSLRKALAMFSLSAVAFTFQACYGSMQDFGDDVYIEGIILASDTQEPIPHIHIQLKDTYFETYSGQDGSFSMFVPSDTTYMLLAYDIDSLENGLFYNAKEIIDNSNWKKELYTTIELRRAN